MASLSKLEKRLEKRLEKDKCGKLQYPYLQRLMNLVHNIDFVCQKFHGC